MMDLKKSIEEFDLVFLDLETTGLDVVEGDSICEIGAFKVRRRQVIDKFHSLVNPKKKVPHEAYLIHKISDEDLKGAPYFESVAASLTRFIDGAVICAYNVKFDMMFLNYELKRMGYSSPEKPAIDILAMARSAFNLPRYNLSAIAGFFKIDCAGGFHRALDDAGIAQRVFFALRDILKEKGIDHLEDFISLYGMDNEIFKQQENAKILLIEDARRKKAGLRLKYFSADNIITQKQIESVNLGQEDRGFYLWCHSLSEPSFRIQLNNVLELDII